MGGPEGMKNVVGCVRSRSIFAVKRINIGLSTTVERYFNLLNVAGMLATHIFILFV